MRVWKENVFAHYFHNTSEDYLIRYEKEIGRDRSYVWKNCETNQLYHQGIIRVVSRIQKEI